MKKSFESKDHLMSEIADQNLNNMENHSLMEKDHNLYSMSNLKLELSESKSDCYVNSQDQINEHLGSIEHIQSYVSTQAAGVINCIKTKANTEILIGIEDYESGLLIPQNLGTTKQIKSEVNTEISDDVAGSKLGTTIQNFDETEHTSSEVYDVKYNNNAHPKSHVENVGDIEHLKPELSDETFDDVKPCIAALRASVAAYSVNQGREEAELEPSPNTEMASQEMLEHNCGTASNTQEANQESVHKCPSVVRTIKRKEMDVKKNLEHSGKIKSSVCPKTFNEFCQDAEKKKTTTTKVSQLQQEILHEETFSDGPFKCFWCLGVYFQFVDRESHMKCSHRAEYGKLLQEKHSQHVKGFHQNNGLHPCRMSSSSQSGKSLQIAHLLQSSEICCYTKSERNLIKTETPVDRNKSDSEQNEQGRRKVASGDISKQICKRLCNMQKTEDHKEFSSHNDATKNEASSLFSHSENMDLKMETSKLYTCGWCETIFGSACQLSMHKRTCTSQQPYKRDVLDKGFKESSNFFRHKRTHRGETCYKCDVCDKEFRHSGNLNKHKRTHTGETPYMCDVCGKSFRQSGHLSVHKRTHTGETPYKCDMCGKSFAQSGHLSVHIITHTGETPYMCDVCGKGFGRSSHLSLHKRTHTGATPYKCDVCNKGFGDPSNFSVHKRIHTGETPYKCDLCGKGFVNTSNLSVHKRTHTGETPYKCDVCNKGFGSSGSLCVHKRIHTGETPYKCDLCGKGFVNTSNLSVHKRTHTGETPYKCDVCNKGFGSSSSLSVHKRTHTGKTPHKCDLCGKGFVNTSNLSVHKRTHTGKTPYKCTVCGKGFVNTSNLSVHKRTHTGKTPE